MLELTILFSVGLSLFLALALLIWFDTSAVVEYGKLFGLSKLMHIKEFEETFSFDSNFSYPKFLNEHYNNFFTRLIVCPVCSCIFSSILSNVALYCLIAGIFVSPLTVLWMIPGICLTSYLGLFLYFKLLKLMSNE